jgi:hypothetical protein
MNLIAIVCIIGMIGLIIGIIQQLFNNKKKRR